MHSQIGKIGVLEHSSLAHFAEQVLSELCAAHPLGYVPKIAWRGYRVSAGMAYYRIGTIGLSKTIIHDEARLRDTLVHEYAHLLAYQRHGRRGVGHGAPWKQAMFDLGAAPKVRHDYEVQRNSRRQEVAYQCQRCGALVLRSRKLPKRRRYIHTDCGGTIKFAWSRAVMPQASIT